MRNRFLRLVAALALTSAGVTAQAVTESTPPPDTAAGEPGRFGRTGQRTGWLCRPP